MSCSANREYVCVRRSLRCYCNLLSVSGEGFLRNLYTHCTQYLAETLIWELTVLFGEVYLQKNWWHLEDKIQLKGILYQNYTQEVLCLMKKKLILITNLIAI